MAEHGLTTLTKSISFNLADIAAATLNYTVRFNCKSSRRDVAALQTQLNREMRAVVGKKTRQSYNE